MKKFIIKTLGCKTNQLESATIVELLSCNGFKEVQNIRDADFYILNSCSVTHIADSKNLSYLRHAKHENPNIKTVLTGCMAQLQKEKLLNNNIADFVIGNYEKNDIAEIIKNHTTFCVSDIFSHDEFRYQKINQTGKTRAFVKIQDGCNNRCSYCTIPFARGKNRSNSIKNIIEQINLFVEHGYYETVLTGIHIGQWGMDFKEKKSLIYLLEEIEKTPIKRYRLGSLNPQEFDDSFINFLSQSEKFCPHFHLSLQSVCDKTLKNMNRYYTAEKIKELVCKINKKFDNAFIGCDIIAGFPGETIEDYEVTLNNLKLLNISKIHVFPYSRRKGTKADLMENQVEDLEKKRRAALIQEVSDEKHIQFLKNNINCVNEVIFEKRRDKKTNFLKGVTKNYISLLCDTEDKYKDTLQKVLITGFSIDKSKLIAKIVT